MHHDNQSHTGRQILYFRCCIPESLNIVSQSFVGVLLDTHDVRGVLLLGYVGGKYFQEFLLQLFKGFDVAIGQVYEPLAGLPCQGKGECAALCEVVPAVQSGDGNEPLNVGLGISLPVVLRQLR